MLPLPSHSSSCKYWFGSANEMGFFEMCKRSLLTVEFPLSFFFPNDPPVLPTTIRAAVLRGVQPILVKLQALVRNTSAPTEGRIAAGCNENQIPLILAVLNDYLGRGFLGNNRYLNAPDWLTVHEPIADLGIFGSQFSVTEQFV